MSGLAHTKKSIHIIASAAIKFRFKNLFNNLIISVLTSVIDSLISSAHFSSEFKRRDEGLKLGVKRGGGVQRRIRYEVIMELRSC